MKERLDLLLVNRGYYQSRERAKASIMAGIVYVNGQKSDKAGTMVDIEAKILVKETLCPYVSRGGLKLEKSMDLWDIHLEGKTCMDIGASTGGFTDCMLQKGAEKVYAVDVGRGQLDYKLRIDDRVINMEKCNIRYIDRDKIDPIDFISIDVSFISLKLVFPIASKLLKEKGSLVCLVKPQFEAGRDKVSKGGVVKDKTTHKEVLKNVMQYGLENDLVPLGLTFSPITGAKSNNIEYLLFLMKKEEDSDIIRERTIDEGMIEKIVNSSHEELE